MSSVFLHFFLFLFSYTLFSAKQIYKKNNKKIIDLAIGIMIMMKAERRYSIMDIFEPLKNLAYLGIVIICALFYFYLLGLFFKYIFKKYFSKK